MPVRIAVPLLALAVVAASACRTEPEAPPSPAGYRDIAQGYSLLYALASQQKDLKKLLIIKRESDAVDEVISKVAEAMAEISEQLEDLAGRYPALTIDVQFLPEVEARARESITEATTAALLGNSGRRVERLLLLKQSTALEVEQHISKVMIELETDEERRAFWTRTERRIADLRAAVDRLLERDYFCEAPS